MKKVILISVIFSMMMTLALQASAIETQTFTATDKYMAGARYKATLQALACMKEKGFNAYKPVSIRYEQLAAWSFRCIMVCEFYK